MGKSCTRPEATVNSSRIVRLAVADTHRRGLPFHDLSAHGAFFPLFLFIFPGTRSKCRSGSGRPSCARILCFTNAVDWIQLRQMQGYSARRFPSAPRLCLRCAYACFFPAQAPRASPETAPEGMPGRLTRVLFDYYFGTYRALVVSLCGHMAVRGWLRWR